MIRRTTGTAMIALLAIWQPCASSAAPGSNSPTRSSNGASAAGTAAGHSVAAPSAKSAAAAVPTSSKAPPTVIDAVAAIAAAVLTYLCCHPILAFLRRGWGIKKADIFSGLSDDAKRVYLKTFGYAASSDPKADFEAMYQHRYGRYRLTTPLLLLVVTAFPLLYLECCTGLAGLTVTDSAGARAWSTAIGPGTRLYTLPAIATAAVAGAFAWVAAALADGATRYNLPPQAVLGATLRLAVSIPLGYAIASVARDDVGPFVAFAMGAFPLAEVQILLKRIATSKLGLEAGADHQKDQVSMLDGIDQPTADRLEDGDVLTIAQLAYCDPVQLSMRTNISFTAIIDAQSQALAWIYLGDNLVALRAIGLRGALEIANVAEDLGQEGDEADAANAFLAVASARTAASPDGSARTPIAPEGLRRAFEEIAGDPYTLFLAEVWASTGASDDEEKGPTTDGHVVLPAKPAPPPAEPETPADPPPRAEGAP